MDFVNKALILATKAHEGQTRWGGEPYINHPVRVANKFKGDIYKAVSLLHDILEDTDVTVDDLNNFPLDVIRNVVILTKKKDESYLHYILNIKRSQIAVKIKLADIADNIKDAKGSLKAKYELARYILDGTY